MEYTASIEYDELESPTHEHTHTNMRAELYQI